MGRETLDFEACHRQEKEVVEGLCLSYDVLRGHCIETDQACEAWVETVEESAC